jgi:DNA repair exonuclease SbcCD ATPase subunit|tara:strand:- start:317 stop:2005 length:1689 start_codon:yes stop_codon:yes gene_type:complete
VKWKNFLSTGNTSTSIDLDRNPQTLIVGDNGAGKSTILDALCFGLFGKPFRVISKNQLINSINGSGTEVEVTFQIGTKNYKVFRSIKPNKFEIYCDDVMVNQEAHARDYQKILEQQILKLNYGSFTQVVILGSASWAPFMQLKAMKRREVVEEILDIKIFSMMNMIVKTHIKNIVDETREVSHKFEVTQTEFDLSSKYINESKSEKAKLRTDKKRQIEQNKKEIGRRENEIDELKSKKEEYLGQILDANKVEQKIQKMLGIRATLVEKHKSHSKSVDFFKDNETCPTCDQEIAQTFKDEILSTKQGELDELEDGMKQLKQEMENTQKRQEEIETNTQNIRELDVKISSIGYSKSELEKFNVKLETELTQLDSNEKSADETNLDGLQTKLDELDKQQSSLKDEQQYNEAAKAMLQDTGIKTKIIKQYLPIMNKLINAYLQSMEFYVNFNLDENFNETIKSRFRDDFNYASFSEGEKMRIDLALLFTWRAIAKMKNSTNTNLLILDEIFDSSLDGTGTEEFLKILGTLENENIFVISHKGDQLTDKFRNSIRFEKIRNFSHVAA